MSQNSREIGCAVIGFGASHNFGWMHGTWIQSTPGLALRAVCDRDPERLKAAATSFPGIRTYATTAELYADPAVEMVTLVTPNYTHCGLAVEAFANGRHVLTENAMCLTVAEADRMIDAAKSAGRMLCVHHNRRHDGNYRTIKEIVDSSRIGEVFHVELSACRYRNPFAKTPDSWWADRKLSGGAFYYYGPQAIDWLLDLIPQRIRNVTGFCHKMVWQEMTNEDQVTALIRFENGAVANFTESYIDSAPKPFWRILGTEGAIVDTAKDAMKGYQQTTHMPSTGSLRLITAREGVLQEETVPYKDSDWHMFYRDIARHLLDGAPVPVDGECGRRVMGVIESARKSCASGQAEDVPYR